MENTITSNNEKSIISAVHKHGGFIDNHSGEFTRMDDNRFGPIVLCRYTHGKRKLEDVCPVYTGTVNCLNGMYVDNDGFAHLSTYSVGGNVWYGNIQKFNREYNQDDYPELFGTRTLEVIYGEI